MALPCPCQHSTGTNKGACKLRVGMGMWVRLIAIVAAALGPAHPTRLNGTDLWQLCTQSPAQCVRYIHAVANLLYRSGCRTPPTDIEAVAITLRYLRAHPDELSNDAVALIHLALGKVADCGRRPLGLWDALGD
jgi:hypothetical protein